ncbi:hypothetical protein [Rhizobium leguminosarum]|uniref:hypothetical protein n=1 Tax=Rhizobium leguminosarum TaxID=384 RepID=UPI001C905702|nr:hypothetical protein [Rhizobium leguminosarum]MBY2984861.1 hypothetical protein [Rhizobium leguminosarum]
MTDLKIYLDAGQDSSAELSGLHRPCAYVALTANGKIEMHYLGVGNLRDMNAASAEALLAALTDIYADLDSSDLPPVIEIICASPGFWKRLDLTHQAETLNPKRAQGLDQHDCWKKLATLAAVFDLAPPRKPSSPSEEDQLKRVTQRRKELAKEATRKVPRDASGITESWREDGEPNA